MVYERTLQWAKFYQNSNNLWWKIEATQAANNCVIHMLYLLQKFLFYLSCRMSKVKQLAKQILSQNKN